MGGALQARAKQTVSESHVKNCTPTFVHRVRRNGLDASSMAAQHHNLEKKSVAIHATSSMTSTRHEILGNFHFVDLERQSRRETDDTALTQCLRLIALSNMIGKQKPTAAKARPCLTRPGPFQLHHTSNIRSGCTAGTPSQVPPTQRAFQYSS